MSEHHAPEILFGDKPVRDLEDVFNELGLMTEALRGMANRFHSEEYWDTLGRTDLMRRAAIADGLQLEIMLKRFNALIDSGYRFYRAGGAEASAPHPRPTAV
ncbi:MAG: hypothetical protein JSS26_08345 [Nitrospira sp.]|nr:hypothetical protein [Nitrospira sp.]